MTQIILARNQQNTSNQPNKVTPPPPKKKGKRKEDKTRIYTSTLRLNEASVTCM